MQGSYQICWNNEMARFTAKVIQFNINFGDQNNNDNKEILKKSI